jgi:hypothetical protein
MARNFNPRIIPRTELREKPVRATVFWASMAVTVVCVVAVGWMVISHVPTDELGMWPRALIVVLFVISAISSLAITEVIPWRSGSWAEWRKPKALGAVAGLMIGAAGLIATVGPLFNAPAAEQKTQVEIRNTVQGTDKKIDELTLMLRAQFPDDPPILDQISGHWGDLEPACEVVWDIRIVKRGEKAAIVAKTLKTPGSVKSYDFVGEIIRADSNSLYVGGVEPKTARGSSSRFDLNPATQRLTWDDPARGSGGVEVYRPCP